MNISIKGKRKSLLIILFLVCFSAVMIFLLLPKQEISFAVPWQDEHSLAVLNSVIQTFEEENKRVKVSVKPMDLGDLNDIWRSENPRNSFHIAVKTDSSTGNYDQIQPWTGNIWSLYYNKALLEKVGWIGVPPYAFTNGSASLEEWEKLFALLEDQEITPLSVGGQYTWPLAALIQHLTLYEDSDLHLNEWKKEEEIPESFASALKRFENWVDRGWINGDYLMLDWPASILQTAGGKSAFVLMASSLSSTIPLDQREGIALLPFPKGFGQEWFVGSIWYLTVPAGTERAKAKAAEKLSRYLGNPENVKLLEQQLGGRFFARDTADTDMLRASLSGNPDSDYMKWLIPNIIP